MTQSVIAIRIGADVGISGAGILINEDRRDSLESVALQVRRESEVAERIIYSMGIVCIDVPDSAREPQRRIHQQAWAERMRIVNGERMRVGPTRSALAWIGEVLETVQTLVGRSVLIRKLRAHQIVLRKAMVDLDVELVIGAAVRTRTEPVIVDTPARSIWLGKQSHHLQRHGIHQIARYA